MHHATALQLMPCFVLASAGKGTRQLAGNRQTAAKSTADHTAAEIAFVLRADEMRHSKQEL